MTVNRGILFRLAVVLAGANLIGIGFAVATDGMAHATVHIVLAAGFGFWAMRLRRLAGGGGDLARVPHAQPRLLRLHLDLAGLDRGCRPIVRRPAPVVALGVGPLAIATA